MHSIETKEKKKKEKEFEKFYLNSYAFISNHLFPLQYS